MILKKEKDATDVKVPNKKGQPNSVDVHVGTRLRIRRTLLGLSQEKLAEAIGLTFQQVQKYERGTNRVSASRLYEFAKVLDIPTSYFFEGFADKSSAIKYGLSDNDQDAFQGPNLLNQKETLELIRVYYSIQDPKLRKDIFNILRTMAENITSGDKKG